MTHTTYLDHLTALSEGQDLKGDHDYTPTPDNPHGEHWVETIEHEDGSCTIIRHGPNGERERDDTEYSPLFYDVMRRIQDLGIPQPSFVARLRKAERDLNPLQDEALQFLDTHGPPTHLQDTDWVDDDDWKSGRW